MTPLGGAPPRALRSLRRRVLGRATTTRASSGSAAPAAVASPAAVSQPASPPGGDTVAAAPKVTEFVGVHWDKKNQKWKAQRQIKDNQQHLGLFDSAEDAARAYDEFVRVRVPGASVNFPKKGTNEVKATKRRPRTEKLAHLTKDARGRYLKPGGAKEYKGVSWDVVIGQWKATCCRSDGKNRTMYFPCDKQTAAAEWYDKKARMCSKKDVNFPVGGEMQTEKGVKPLSAASSSTSGQSAGQHGYVGVYRDRQGWQAYVRFNRKHVCCGIYHTPLKAARAVDNGKRLLRLRCGGGIPPHLLEMNFPYLPGETQAVRGRQSDWRKRYVGALKSAEPPGELVKLPPPPLPLWAVAAKKRPLSCGAPHPACAAPQSSHQTAQRWGSKGCESSRARRRGLRMRRAMRWASPSSSRHALAAVAAGSSKMLTSCGAA